MLEAVPLLVERRRRQAVRAGEVDDDGVVRRLERRGLLVAEAEEDDVGAGRRSAASFGTNAGRCAVQPQVEGRRRPRPASESEPSDEQLELGVGQDAIERLLAAYPEAPRMAAVGICVYAD